ncbi:MAG TPA: hypothetical protein VKB19_20655 [Pedobacter sp.]|nr:hypothetical protein [Pedobacter sp.]
MNKTFRRLALCILFATIALQAYSQAELLPIGHDLNNKAGKDIYFNDKGQTHTSLKQLFISDFTDSISKDSLLNRYFPAPKAWQSSNWVYRKLFLEHLVEVNNEDYSFYLDFLPDLQIGKQGDRNLWVNTRGLEIGGRIGKKFAFTSHFFEDQAKFADYYTNSIFETRVVPGQGRSRFSETQSVDYGYSGGSLSYTPSKYINVQLGYDKNFIGDGYRSLLLSDNSFNYPFLKLTGTLGKVRYMAMYAQFIDFYDEYGSGAPGKDYSFPKKNGVFHYLSWNATKRLSLGLFENVMWAQRAFEFSYVSPLIFARPVEFANGSPDKMVLGLNGSYKIADRYVAYGQFVLNEFKSSDFFSSKGSFRNKHGQQIGIKGFDVFKVSNLFVQAEYNTARPYTYSSTQHITNYGHYNQPLAHPFGGNFREMLGIVNYRYKRFDARLQLTSAMYGLDTEDKNYGKNIYKSYDNRVSDEGIFTGNGLKTDLLYADARLAYVLNPKNNLRIELGYIYRKESNEIMNNKQQIVNIGIRSSFRNLYTDF